MAPGARVSFEANVGQTDPGVLAVGRAADLQFFLTHEGLAFAVTESEDSAAPDSGRPRTLGRANAHRSRTVIRMGLEGAHLDWSRLVLTDELPGRSNYLIGRDPAGWHTDIRRYARLTVKDVYPGIDLQLHGEGGHLVYDFAVHPGADPSAVRLSFEGMKDLRATSGGDLVLATPHGELRHRAPRVWQGKDHERAVSGGYRMKRGGRVGFEVGPYDRGERLVIDPTVIYSTTFGGTTPIGGRARNDILDAAADDAGNAYLTGQTNTLDFSQTVIGSKPVFNGVAFVAKVDPSGALLWATYLGGERHDGGSGIAVDSQGRAYVTGVVTSNSFPVVNAFQDHKDPSYFVANAFISVLDPTGTSLVYSSYLGGSTVGGTYGTDDEGYAIALDPSGKAVVAGYAQSIDFPTSSGAYKERFGPGNVFNSYDAFVAKFDIAKAGRDSLVFSTLLGGTSDDLAFSLAVDSAGNMYLAGQTDKDVPFASQPPLSPDPGEGFLAQLLASGASLGYWTYTLTRDGHVAWDPTGTAYLAGTAPDDGLGGGVYLLTVANGSVQYCRRGLSSGQGLGDIVIDTSVSPGVPYALGFTFLPGETPSYWIGTGGGCLATEIPLEGFDTSLGGGGTVAIAYSVLGRLFVAGQSTGGGILVRVTGLQLDTTPAIQILTSTERWKPQHDDTDNITVDIRGPSDLDLSTVRLEVIPPAGFLGTYTPTTSSVKRVKDTDDRYMFDWTGPWAYTDSSGHSRPMPRGNYSLTVFGKRAGSGTELHNEEPFDRVSLVEVTTVSFEAEGPAPLGNNPGPGRGLRIFAEASQPGGHVSDKVRVTATIDPTIPDPTEKPVKVFFRSFDVDDPSASSAPVDDETQPADNCVEADQGPPQNCPVADDGFLYDPVADPNAQSPANGRVGLAILATVDRATAGLRVATLQGANYRVAASTASAWLDQITVPQGVSAGELLHPAEDLVMSGRATQMLTVWRSLHLQTVRMALPSFPQSALELQAIATCPEPPCIQGNLLVDTDGIPHPDHGDMTNAWAGADVDVTLTTPPGAPRSDKHVVKNSTATTLLALTTLTPHDPDFGYVVWDDEIASLSIWTEPDVALAREVLRDAYIEIDTVAGVAPAFDRNLSDADVAALPMATLSSPEYWTAPVVLAFEGDEQGKDGDPTTERYTFGLTNGPELGQWSREPRVTINSETIRDYSETPLASPPAPVNRVSRDEIMTNTTAHEILHLFGLIHDGDRQTGGLMCGAVYVDANEPNRRKITPVQFRRLREATEARIRRDPRDCR